MTAIVRKCTDGGFVIAADGLQNERDGSIVGRAKQKIFSFAGNKFLAYSFTGRIGIGPDDGDEITFDFIKQFQEAAESTSIRRSQTLKEYAQRIAMRVNQKLEETCKDPRIMFGDEQPDEPGSLGSTVADVLIDGYRGGIPHSVEVRFYRISGALAEPSISVQDDLSLMSIHALYDAILYARAYIEGCSGPEAQRIDSEHCSKIGGHIHIAVITKDHGFEWVPGHEPISNSGV